MHNSYFFLHWLVKELRPILINGRITSIYSQEKDVLVMRYINKSEGYIKAHLKGNFACLSFPLSQSRAKRNSADLFSELIDLTITDVQMVDYDRSFFLSFSNDFQLVFKMHGQRSNLLLLEGGNPKKIFKNSLKSDKTKNISALKRIFPSLQDFSQSPDNIRGLLPIITDNLEANIKGSDWDELTVADKYKRLADRIEEYQKCEEGWLIESEKDFKICLFNCDEGEVFQNPIDGITSFSSKYLRKSSFSIKKQGIETSLRQKLKKSYSYLKKTENQLLKVESQGSHSDLADLIMAHLYLFENNVREADIMAFDGSGTVSIRLKENMTAIQYAQVLYRKGKNKKIEIDTIKKNLDRKRVEVTDLERKLDYLNSITDSKELDGLKSEISKADVIREVSDFHEFEYDGFKIRVGRNAKNNDKLTFGNGYKEDLWLHVKDARGSHVLLKHRSDRKFSKDSIEKAAQLAAYYSKRSTEGLVPVIFTPRKYVRKRKGDPAGMVVVDREEVLLIEPGLWGDNN